MDEQTALVGITVLNLRLLRKGRSVYAMLDAELNIGGIVVTVMGIQVRRVPTGGTSIHLPTFRDADGSWRAAVQLPEEVREALCDAVLVWLVEEGVAVPKAAPETTAADAELDDFGAGLVARKGVLAGVDLG